MTYECEVAGGDAEADGQLSGEALLGEREHGLHQDVRDDGLDYEALPPGHPRAQAGDAQTRLVTGRRRDLQQEGAP